MNEKCKYCDYVSKCSRKCEYNSILCKAQRSFPKVVNESYEQLQEENKRLNGAIQTYDILLKANVEENKQLKDLVDTILNFELFVGGCPLNFDFGFNSNADKAQRNFCSDEYCEKYCDNNYKKCWLKYFEKLHELEGSIKNEK